MTAPGSELAPRQPLRARSRVRPKRALVIAGALAAALIGVAAPAAHAVTITEFTVPTDNGNPAGITAGPDGAVWFTESLGNKIGRITSDGTFTEFAIPTPNSVPLGITAGPDGALWFTEAAANKIGRVTTGGTFSEFPVPSGFPQPGCRCALRGIAAGPDGNLWFTEIIGKIGRITPTGTFTEFAVPTFPSSPRDIAAGSDGALWFTEPDANQIGRVTTAGTISELAMPSGGNPNDIAAGPDGALWFTAGSIWRLTIAGGFTEYPIPIADPVSPGGITAGPDGALWFSVGGDTNKIGRVTTAGTFGFVTVPTAFASVSELTAGPDGALWFTESSANKIGRGDLTAAGPPAAVSLSPATGTNAAGSEHCVTATVREEIGRTTPDIAVVFAAGPINTAQGTSTTDLGGQTTFCYTGELVGTDQITAFADFDPVNGVRDPGEPAASAQKSWVAPSSTAECSTTNRGRMIAQNGDRVTFRGEAEAVPFGGVSGSETYSDRGPADRLVVRSTAIDAVTCDFRDGAVFGRANVGGTEQSFRIDLHDPGTTGDTYRIRLSAGYDSGVGILSSGSVTVRVGG